MMGRPTTKGAAVSAQLFEYAIILEEDRDENDKVVEKAQVLKKSDVLADSKENAMILISREIPEAYLEMLERVTLAVRPF